MTRRFVLGGIAVAVVLGVAVIQPGAAPRPHAFPPDQAAINARRRKEFDKTMADHPEIKRPMACYRVREEKIDGAIVHRAEGYTAQTSTKGLHFEAGGSYIDLRATRVEQGETKGNCGQGAVTNPAFAEARIDRGDVVEEYVFENKRAEQVFRFARPIGEGALRVTVAVNTNLTGKATRRTDGGWMDTTLQDGGIAFADARGTNLIAYRGAMAFDAAGRRVDLEPRFAAGQITLEVPADFMSSATYPVVIDPWLELNFSASGGGLTNSTGTAQTPSVLVIGGGNPWVAWSEFVPTASPPNFEIFFRYWNGFSWANLAGSDSGTGISTNTGDSINPSLAEGEFGPDIAWQDNTSGTSCVFFRRWNGTAWEEVSSSTPFDGKTFTSANTAGGISFGIGTFSGYPSLSEMRVPIPSKGTNQRVPVIAYESTNPGPNSIIVVGWFPGDPGQQQQTDSAGNIIALNFPPIPQGWYAFGFGDSAGDYAVTQMSGTTAPRVSQRPSVAVPIGTHNPVVAWQDTRNGTHDIMVAQYTETGFPGGSNLPTFPTSRPPDFAYGGWAGLGTSFNPGGITNNPAGTVPFSISPSIGLLNGTDPAVAWEQVLAFGTAGVTDSAIYLRQWNNPVATAWNELALSGSGRGISNVPAPAVSATPSLAIEGTTYYVAWQQLTDTSGLGNIKSSEIYVRQFTGGASWNEVGFQSNSASPGPVAGIGGISQTSAGALTPSISSNGGPTVAWQDYASGTPQIYVRRFFQNQPLFLRQTAVGGASVVPFGGSTSATTIELRGTIFSEDTGRLVRMQIEVVNVGSPFVGNVTAQSAEVGVDPATHQSTAEIVLNYTGLVNSNYQWRARTVDDLGQASAWISAGGSDGVTDFSVVAAIAPGAPTLGAPALSGTSVVLTWTGPAGGADSYNVKRSTVSGAEVTIANVAGGSFTDSGVTVGTTYFYKVSAVRGGLEGPDSNEVSIVVTAGGGGGGGGAGAGADSVSRRRCGLVGLDGLILLGLMALRRKRRR